MKQNLHFFIIYRSGESGDAIWQPVSGTRHKFYVYSAFCDDRDRPLVRIIAATKTKKPDKVGKLSSQIHRKTQWNKKLIASLYFEIFD